MDTLFLEAYLYLAEPIFFDQTNTSKSLLKALKGTIREANQFFGLVSGDVVFDVKLIVSVLNPILIKITSFVR